MRLKIKNFSLPVKTRLWIAAVLWLFIGGVAFFYSKPGQNLVEWVQRAWAEVSEKSGRNLKQIKVVWRDDVHYTKEGEILKAIGFAPGDSMGQISLSAVQEKIEKLPWVRTAVIERYWPNTLKITIEEKIPLAIWQHNRTYHPLDERAEIIDTTKLLPADVLLVVGPDAPKHLLSLLRDLEQVPDIYQYVRAAVRVHERRWNLKLFNAETGLEILLPESGVLKALKRLDARNKKDKLVKRQIALIDLRSEEKVVFKPITAEKEKKKVAKK